ncbi:FxsA family protein [Shewanella aestuarii]|uniref:FxsA family protein n=1 Tax=Shewanella aestuarii TaxID=1028752 RepID=A0A6G9QFZ8_9GAMM|nr:FxsA family protein [Shewanella aestuarii]QIR13396.1 FxsA family protein [Shewanella aestuarii]
MFFILFLLFIIVPAMELSVLIQVGDALGVWPTIGLVFFTAIVGVSLVRSQGLNTLMSVQQKLARGEVPGQEIVEGMMLAVAGVLLLIPGFVTDFIGLLLLTPITRAPIAAFMYKRMQMRVVANGSFGQQGPFNQGPFNQSPFGQNPFENRDKDGNVFEGDFEHKHEPRPETHQIEVPPQDDVPPRDKDK